MFRKKKILFGVLIIFIFAGIIIFLFIIKPILNSASAPSSPMKLDLSISNAPALGETAEITATITYIFGQNKDYVLNTTANITLPEGFELINGYLDWEGIIKPEVPEINFSILIKSVKTGDWTIEGRAKTPPTGSTYFGGRDFIYISVMEDEAIISDVPFPKREGRDNRAIEINDSDIPEIIPDEDMITPEPTGEFIETELP